MSAVSRFQTIGIPNQPQFRGGEGSPIESTPAAFEPNASPISGQDEAIIGGKPSAAPPQRQVGLIKAGRILWTHTRHADNRDEVLAMTHYFLPRLAKYVTLVIPFGFLLAGPVEWMADKQSAQGEKKINQLIEAGKLNPDNGPLGCAMQIERNWVSALDRKSKLTDGESAKALMEIQSNWNKMANHLFPDDQDGISLVREKIKLQDDSKMLNLVARAFHANRHPGVRFFKNFARQIKRPLFNFILKPVRLFMIGLGLLMQGTVMLKNGPAVTKLLSQATRKIA